MSVLRGLIPSFFASGVPGYPATVDSPCEPAVSADSGAGVTHGICDRLSPAHRQTAFMQQDDPPAHGR